MPHCMRELVAAMEGRLIRHDANGRRLRHDSGEDAMNVVTDSATAPDAASRTIAAAAAAAFVFALPLTASAQEWRHYAGGVNGRKYSPLDQITKANVDELRVAWRAPSPDLAFQDDPVLRRSRNEDTPLMVNGRLYSITGLGIVSAYHPATGEVLWRYDPESYALGRPNNGGFLQRGMGYWTDGAAERLLIGTADAYLLSLYARTGEPDPAFGEGGRVDLTIGIRDVVRSANFSARRPLVAGDVVVVGNSIGDVTRSRRMPPGDVQAYDVRTGRKLWTFHTIPKEYEAGYDTWLNGSAEYTGNANVWAGIAYDPALDYLYMASSTPTNNLYGGERPGDNLYAESVICVEAQTGVRVWHFQAVHHGIWDYDFAAMPVLGEITVDGRRIKAIMQVSKQAFTYVFDRETGEPVWPIEERPVPPSTTPGEQASPTQPFPTRPPPFDLQGTTADNLIDFTPELRQRALERLERFDYGPLYTPPTERGLLMLPGMLGASNWGGAGFDQETGVLYVPSRTSPSVVRPTRFDAPRRPRRAAAETTIDGLPLFKPPWARLTAIDMHRGEVLWTSPLGDGPRNHPLLRGLDLPPLGDHIDGQSVLVTKTLVFASVWRRDRRDGSRLTPSWHPWGDPDAGRKLVYAFDKQTGELLHVIEMDGFAASAPMSYLHDGKQYLAMTVGGNEDNALVALSLPD